ncbi:DUF4350 domain-containing protein [Agromyces atrinae]|uniref:DUF4350 domain-containing protein n=1 Tax=Agromyces atrinae TaxID=592376 RepID=A0A4Q2MBC4_9MICO|nr:DUF4350 domain-containing protein [Agromyces atrinae]NYD66646.1 hypothetical protein [Agromyces atrinae]RXZ87312.1 DUF4350 domain-containing protein [Agromyces atrinae]
MTLTLTPTVRQSFRRRRIWIVFALLAIAAAVATLLIQNAFSAAGRPLAADSPAPGGAQAVVEVLRDQGVDVTVASSLDDAVTRAEATDATLFVHDGDALLDGRQWSLLADSTPRLVVAAPGFTALRAIAPGVATAGVADDTPRPAQCDIPAATRAESLSGALRSLSTSEAEGDVVGCFPDDDGAFALVDAGDVALVSDTAVFANESIVDGGSAALALGLLGERDHLVWYLPVISDVDADTAPTLAEITPGWVSPAITLLIVATIAAGVWRGRRFGPLVAEDLPVVVRASETMEGRARLYARTSDRGHALDALRAGTLGRLARHLGLGATAPAREIADATAGLIDGDRAAIHALLVDASPLTDRDLVTTARDLHDLEQRVTDTLRPRTMPTEPEGTRP